MTMNPLPPQAYTKETLLKAYQWLMLQDNSIKDMATTPDILVSLYLKIARDGQGALDRPSIQNFKSELRSLAGIMGELDRPNVTHEQVSVSAPTNPPPQQSPRQSKPQLQAQTQSQTYAQSQNQIQPMLTPQPQVSQQTQAQPQTSPVQQSFFQQGIAATQITQQPQVQQFNNMQVQQAQPPQVHQNSIIPQFQNGTHLPTTPMYIPSTPLSFFESRDMSAFLDEKTMSMIHEVKVGLNLSSDAESLRVLVKLGHSRAKGLYNQ